MDPRRDISSLVAENRTRDEATTIVVVRCLAILVAIHSASSRLSVDSQHAILQLFTQQFGWGNTQRRANMPLAVELTLLDAAMLYNGLLTGQRTKIEDDSPKECTD